MRLRRLDQRLSLALTCTLGMAVGCGQEPSFFERDSDRRSSADASAADRDGSSMTGGETMGDREGDEVTMPGGGADGGAPDVGDGGGGGDTPGSGPMPEIPGAGAGDLPALHKCLSAWKNNPFKGTVRNFQRISASVTVGGFGNAINDSESTEEPFLVLVDAGVNVLGSPTYNLLNRNGYYCLKVNVNVMASLTVNLHCNARLADQRVNVNVLSQQNDTTSSVGVHVLSNVSVSTVRPEGDTCIR